MSSGLVYIHQAPSSLLAHIEWTVSGVSGAPVSVKWQKLPSPLDGFTAAIAWSGPEDGGAILASSFMNLRQLTFEVVQDFELGSTGLRWSFKPNLGLYQAATDAAGNILISENQIRAALSKAGDNPLKLQAEIRRLLGQNFDDELEIYRELAYGPEGNNGIMSAETEGIANRQNLTSL
jgi:hypothetical protein